MRSYVVKRRLHFRHSRLRRMVSPPRPSRESITLSSTCAQKGHFTRLGLLIGPHRPLNLSHAPTRATSPTIILPESETVRPPRQPPRSRSAKEPRLRPWPAPFLPQISSYTQAPKQAAHRPLLPVTAQPIQPARTPSPASLAPGSVPPF